MNIFVLDKDPCEAAAIQVECAGHYSYKLILESAQMLSTAMRSAGYTGDDIYKSAYINHPCTVWVRQNQSNALWLIEMALEMCCLYTERSGKIYASQSVIERCLELIDLLPPGDLTVPALAVNSTKHGVIAQEVFKDILGTWEGAIAVYRYFYFQSKDYLRCCII
jgi:hypothetical protein